MWTQRQLIRGHGAARGCRSRARLTTSAAIVSCTLGFMASAQTASSQTLDGLVEAVQPSAVQAAERHQARLTGNDALVDVAVVQHPHQKPAVEIHSGAISPAGRTVLQDSRVRDGGKTHNTPRSKPMSRTARAYLESDRQATGLPSTAMVCQDCEPPPCSLWDPCRSNNSPIIDGAAIVVQR